MPKTLRWFLLVSCMGLASAQAAVLQVSGGELTGALGVNVGGALYDVEFVEGTCIALFSGCDQASDFTFTTSADAQAASQALLDQVFLDGPQGNFDSVPALTFGCELSTAALYCSPLTPYSVAVGSVENFEVFNYPIVDSVTGPGFLSIAFDTTSSAFLVYARWSPAAARVPEPGTLALLGIALAGLAFRRRKRA